MNDPCDWWHYFDKIDGNRVACKTKNCDWIRDRGKTQPTNILKNHLKNAHKDLYKEKLNAEQAKAERLKKEKEALDKQRSFFKSVPAPTKNDNDNPAPAKNDDNNPAPTKKIKMFPIFGKILFQAVFLMYF